MKWILALAVVVGLLWLGGDRVSEWISAGRETAGGLTEPVYGLANTLDQTRTRVQETNRKIEALSGQASGVASGSASAYGAAARRDLQALTR